MRRDHAACSHCREWWNLGWLWFLLKRKGKKGSSGWGRPCSSFHLPCFLSAHVGDCIVPEQYCSPLFGRLLSLFSSSSVTMLVLLELVMHCYLSQREWLNSTKEAERIVCLWLQPCVFVQMNVCFPIDTPAHQIAPTSLGLTHCSTNNTVTSAVNACVRWKLKINISARYSTCFSALLAIKQAYFIVFKLEAVGVATIFFNAKGHVFYSFMITKLG